ncbi:MAG: carboxylating nicotinate-nucleotide diphosphorylase [Candidatus Omnitrophica bacterium]|nr:carboxylating nicotinate-nucleotide diphosphorylase [Candidatus Omnitrophota bacterium]
MGISKEDILPIIMSALREDVGSGDITNASVFDKDTSITACIIAKEPCVLAGIDIARWVFDVLDEKINFRPLAKDGDVVKKGKKVASLRGSVKNILTGERTALNFLGALCGIATLTKSFVDEIKGTKAGIFDTRKTMPGMRALAKHAVKVAGGSNHRTGLWDGILIKDNHIYCSTPHHKGAGHRLQVLGSSESVIAGLVRKSKAKGYKNVEIEVENLKEFKEALEAGADIILLDNMKIEDARKAVSLKNKRKGPRPLLEYSGGVRLGNVRRIAKTGVDRISIGFLTHSAPSIDLSLEICP